MTEWDEFDQEVEECNECGTLSNPELCPKHEILFENWHKTKEKERVS